MVKFEGEGDVAAEVKYEGACLRRTGASTVIDNRDGKAVEKIMTMTGGRGVYTAIEAVGVPESFLTC